MYIINTILTVIYKGALELQSFGWIKKMMKITISNKLNTTGFPSHMAKVIQDRLTFPNPKYLENLKMNRWNGETPEYLKFYYFSESGDMILPRGFISNLVSLCRHQGVEFEIDDRRRTLPEFDFTFKGQARPFQQESD